MNINDLKIYIAAVELESLTKAAAVNNTAQSNASARIKNLEQALGTSLLKRTTRSLTTTGDGAKFLRVAREIVMAIDAFKDSLTRDDTPPGGMIRIGCIHSTAALRAPGILSAFTAGHPNVDFKLKTGTTAALIKDVLDFKLDGAFIAGRADHPALSLQPVIEEELCLVSSALYPSLERLSSSEKPVKLIVFNHGCSYRALLEELLESMRLKKLRFVEMDTLESIINTVESGLGVTLLPLALIKKDYAFRDLATFPLPDRFARSQTTFIRRADYPMTKAYAQFWESLVKGYQL
ncbi:MAG TPA: LysR family transcriptional regulator [Puia sp.]|nr:LysR family transcriptional regulator [Puia sp.]